MAGFQSLPGFRDFYPEDFSRRQHIFRVWRQNASVFGFQEYDAPVLEPLELYTQKSGDEIGIFPEVGPAFDAVSFVLQSPGVSQGRFPDGAARIVNFDTTPSPSDSNYLPIPNVVINEILANTNGAIGDIVPNW